MTTEVSDARRLAARIAGGGELLDIRAVRFAADLEDPSVDPPYDVGVEMSPTYDLRAIGDEGRLWLAVFSVDYDLKVMSEDITAARLQCTYTAAYQLRMSSEPSDDELTAFGDTTVMLAMYPYLRQFAQDATARFNLLPVVMPLYREPLRLAPDASRPPAKKTAAKKAAKALPKKAASKKVAPKK
jgi:hypothetical protein